MKKKAKSRRRILRKIIAAILGLALLLTAAASAEVYEGRTAALRTREVYAEGTAETLCVEVGQNVSDGETLLTLHTQKIFAAQDGTVARVLADEGETVDGAVLEIAPQTLYTVYCTADEGYASAEAGLLHPGETVYLRCFVGGTHRAVGIVTNPDGESTTGTIEEVLDIAENGAYRVRIIPDETDGLRIGQSVAVRTD